MNKSSRSPISLLASNQSVISATTSPMATCFYARRRIGKTPVLTLSLPKNPDATCAPEPRHVELKELIMALTELTELIEEFKKVSGLWIDEREYGGSS